MRFRAGNLHGAGSTPGAYSETRDRRPVRLECASVRLRVDPASEPAHDGEARSRELPAEAARDGGAVAG